VNAVEFEPTRTEAPVVVGRIDAGFDSGSTTDRRRRRGALVVFVSVAHGRGAGAANTPTT